MANENLSTIEKKVLGALLILADDNMEVVTTLDNVARTMGYKKSGGMVSSALRILEYNNFITKLGKQQYKVLL